MASRHRVNSYKTRTHGAALGRRPIASASDGSWQRPWQRRGWDSNPRDRLTRPSGFQDRCGWIRNPRPRAEFGPLGCGAGKGSGKLKPPPRGTADESDALPIAGRRRCRHGWRANEQGSRGRARSPTRDARPDGRLPRRAAARESAWRCASAASGGRHNLATTRSERGPSRCSRSLDQRQGRRTPGGSRVSLARGCARLWPTWAPRDRSSRQARGGWSTFSVLSLSLSCCLRY